jgi:hypothetical protein
MDAVAHFGATPDPLSLNGSLLADLVPESDYVLGANIGRARFSTPRRVALTPTGIDVAKQGDEDAGPSLPLPAPVDFTIHHAAGGIEVAIKLLTPKLPMPGFTGAALDGAGTPRRSGEDVSIVFPDLAFVIPASDAKLRLDPLFPPNGVVEVTMSPALAIVGPGEVVAIGFADAAIDYGADPAIRIGALDIYVTPPGIPSLVMRGTAGQFEIGLGASNPGLTGEAQLELSADPAERPAFLDNAKGRIRLTKSVVTLLELTGGLKLRERIEAFFQAEDPDSPEKIAYLARLVPTPSEWEISLQLRAAGDADFLWRTREGTLGNLVGAYSVFAPMFIDLAAPGAGGLRKVGVSAALVAPIAAANIFKTRSVTVLGGELRMINAGQGPEAFLFLDIETEFDLDMQIVRTKRPLKVRQKAIGFSLAFTGDAAFEPVFDPTRGFSLDLSDPSAFEVPNGPLGDLLQPDRARVARENPMRIEVDLVPKLNLGIVTVDRTTAFVEIDRAGATGGISALGVHLDAGPITGRGFLAVSSNSLEGGLDLSLPAPLSLRLSGQLGYSTLESGETAMFVSLDVGWPVPFPIANSGLGLFGLAGLLGIRYQPSIGQGQTALDWIEASHFRPMDVNQWRPAEGAVPDNLAIGVGAEVGTLEGGFLANAKGALILQLPGPRIMLLMKADILSRRKPAAEPGTILAAIEITPKKLTIGIVAEQKWGALLKVRVPANARFSFGDITDWALDIGRFPEDQPPGLPVSIEFLRSFRADGYIMIHGKGIQHFPLRPLPGFAVAAGVRASIIWGPKEIGLYARVAASVDLGVNFSPSVFAIGRIRLEGELHLFILGIGVSAQATVLFSEQDFQFKATVCGKVEFLFFEVEGCVAIEFGNPGLNPPPPPDLIRQISLMSASPALIQGSGAARPIDATLGNAASGQDPLPAPVPIDAIPVIHFESRPFVPDQYQFMDKTLLPSQIAADTWIQRGGQLYRYRLKSLRISPFAVADDETLPLAWWDKRPAPDRFDDGSDVQLALFTSAIDPSPSASEPSDHRRTELLRRWGDLCLPVAGEVPVLWTALGQHLGGSPDGWVLAGNVMPDAQGTVRSSAAYNTLTVSETWRSNDPVVDALFSINPATVVGNSIGNRAIAAPWTGLELKPCSDDETVLELIAELRPDRSVSLPNSLRLEGGGFRTLRGLIYLREGDMQHLVFRFFDADGQIIGETDGSRMETRRLSTFADLPPEWQEPGTTWAADMYRLFDNGNMDRDMSSRFYESTLLYFDCPIDRDAVPHAVEIGWTDDYIDQSFGLVAIESVTQREYMRREFDEQHRSTQIKAVSGALNFDASKDVLLKPDTEYEIAAEYTVETASFNDKNEPVATPRPDDVDPADWPPAGSQRYRFKTDSEPPARIDSWVLATAPNEDEAFFYLDPITILFSSARVGKLFKAYGKDLSVRVLAASGKHPPSGAAGISLAGLFGLVPAIVTTPFEAALVEMPQLSCVAVTQENRHAVTTIRNALEPSTEYVFELVAGSTSRSSRHNFRTSRYPSLEALAQDVRLSAAPPRHWFVSDASSIAILAPGLVADSQFEEALRGLAWHSPQQDRSANRVTILWKGTLGTPDATPLGVLIETVESVWRQIQTPQQGNIDKPQSRLSPQSWVEVKCDRSPDIIRSASGTRTLIRLPAGQTGELVVRISRLPSFLGDEYPPVSFDLARIDLAPPSQEHQA